jgi:hypothetical protein
MNIKDDDVVSAVALVVESDSESEPAEEPLEDELPAIDTDSVDGDAG